MPPPPCWPTLPSIPLMFLSPLAPSLVCCRAPGGEGKMKRSWSPESSSIKQGRPCSLTPAAAHHLWDEASSEGGWHDPDPLVHAPSSHTFTQRNRDSHLHHRGHNPGWELRIKPPVWCSQGGLKSRWSPKWIQHWNQYTRWLSWNLQIAPSSHFSPSRFTLWGFLAANDGVSSPLRPQAGTALDLYCPGNASPFGSTFLSSLSDSRPLFSLHGTSVFFSFFLF